MKFKTKLYIGFGFLFGLFIISYLIFMIMMSQINQNTKNAVKNYEMLSLANTIQNELNVFSREARGLLANPPEELKRPFKESRDQALHNVNIAIGSLEKLDSREQSQHLIQELKTMSRTLGEMEKEGDGLIKEGKYAEVTQLFWYDSLKVREDMVKVASELQAIQKQTVDTELNQSRKTYKLMNQMIFIYMIAGFLAGISMTIWIFRSVTGNLNKVTSVMTKVAFGQSDQLPRIKVTSKDEIGEIAVAFNEMAQALETHTMQEKELKHAAEEHSWLKTKVAEIATMYPGIDSLEILAQLFITKVAPMTGAKYGVFYMKQGNGEETKYQKLAAYAYNDQEAGKDSFCLGEGLVGQCALENRTISLHQVPADYIKIASGLGSASPANVLVIPAEFQGEVLAVIELASFEPFNPLEQMLLQEVMDNIGMNINSILRHMQVEKLLEDSQTLTEELQSQSEELQLQQEELRTVNEQLEEQYENSEQKTRELEKTKSMLEEKAKQLTVSSQYKSEFLANMSHELRTPLNSLLILAQMLAENADGNLTAKQVEYAGTIFSSGNDLLHLINDILDIAKVEAGKMEILFEDVKLSDVKEVVEAQFIPIAREKKIQLNVQLAPNLPKVIYTDKQRLQQILKNLLSNAFKFTEHGAVSLTIQKVEKEVFSKANEIPYTDIELAFAIKDTGIGIPEEKQDNLFDAFKQADGTISRKYGGTGLGLSISREIAHLLGGFIEVESIEHNGSTFTLYLPNDRQMKQSELSIVEAEVAAGVIEDSESIAIVDPVEFLIQADEIEKQSYGKKALLEGKKILVVDDDMRNIFALTTALESYLVEVLFAENGKEGIAVLQEHPDIDLVLMDIMMPEMDGFEAIRFIRRKEEFLHLPIIALTAKAMKDDRKQCIDAGASDYISKPVNLEQLFSTMQVWLYR
ncbi:response regulator [Bacillus aerolatus]|uniref:Circadian input-output histidine kinase CikA n=1 Tax=Bacillus aerolatus TaxID=2653354 RepID=A0A6I1FE54_9BACI|nr:response regulator [Bacillus aerolatus]KAB7705950.1 response regulator [Bacillus aerolatus]